MRVHSARPNHTCKNINKLQLHPPFSCKMQASLGSRRAAAKDAGLTRAAKPALFPVRSIVQATISGSPDAKCFQVTS